jgi:hypothetical protein
VINMQSAKADRREELQCESLAIIKQITELLGGFGRLLHV